MKIKIEISEQDVKNLITQELSARLEGTNFDATRVKIETKSKQNYKSEWEVATIRATYEGEA